MSVIPPLAVLFFVQGLVMLGYDVYEFFGVRTRKASIQRYAGLLIVESLIVAVHVLVHFLIGMLLGYPERYPILGAFVVLAVSLVCNSGLMYAVHVLQDRYSSWIDKQTTSYILAQSVVTYVLCVLFIFFIPFSYTHLFILFSYSIICSVFFLYIAKKLAVIQWRGMKKSGLGQSISRGKYLIFLVVGIYAVEYFLVWNPYFLRIIDIQ